MQENADQNISEYGPFLHSAIYTNIPHEFTLRAIEYFVSSYRQSLSTQFILEAKKIILSIHSMIFEEMFYLQIQATTMGTIFAPTDATLAMGYHEVKPYTIIKKSYFPLSVFWRKLEKFFRQSFIFLRSNLINPKKLLGTLNKINPAIKLPPFLDIMINKERSKILMEIYSKPYSIWYVAFKSNDPKHCSKSIFNSS